MIQQVQRIPRKIEWKDSGSFLITECRVLQLETELRELFWY